jgi:hypothetical protein
VLDDESSIPWDASTLVSLCEQIGDPCGYQLAEMAEMSWGEEIHRLHCVDDARALEHVAEQVAAIALSRIEPEAWRVEMRERVKALMGELEAQGVDSSEVVRSISDELVERVYTEARKHGTTHQVAVAQ